MKSILIAVLILAVAGCLTALSPTASAQITKQPRAFDYRVIDGRTLKAYVFFPEGQGVRKQTSAILLFHGGGWSAGSAEWTFEAANRFAALGMVAISIDYRLSEGNITPIEALADTWAAFRWARRHAAELNIDPKRVAGYGVSAGGHLVAAAATIACPSDAADSANSKPDLLLLWSPALDVASDGWFRKMLRGRANVSDYSPAEHAGASTPPTCIVHGEKDTLVPLPGVKRFRDRVVQSGGICELITYPGLGHLLTRNLANQESDFDPDPKARADAVAQLERFLGERGYIQGK